MITGSDRPTAPERAGQADCLVDLALDWLQRPLGGMTEVERAAAINEVCLLIGQMRHRDAKTMEYERRRWVERVTVRICTQCGGMRGYEGAVQLEVEQRVLQLQLLYHQWRETHAPKLSERSAR